MRVVFLGAGELAVATARLLLDRGHEVIIIESDRKRIEELSETLDCGFLHGDGAKPPILREAAPKQTDVLFCLSGDDRLNIIAGVIGKSLGFRRVVTRIKDTDFEGICRQLDLHDTIIPSVTISRYLADLVGGRDILELSTLVKGEARFFSFTVAGDDDGKTPRQLELPDAARVVCYYRRGEFRLPEDDQSVAEGDNVVLITHSRNLPDLRRRWRPQNVEGRAGERPQGPQGS